MGRRDKLLIKDDPNNKEWAEDTNRFGYRMLSKMGWTEGTGLGKNKDGIQEHVKAIKKFDTRGIGADSKTSVQLYTAKTVAFSDILKKLAAEYGTATQTEKEEKKKPKTASSDTEKDRTTKKKTNRIHFSRLAKAKNASNYSKEEISAILGKKKHETDKEKKTEEQKEKSSIENGNVLAVSKVNVTDYFKAKMAATKTDKEERKGHKKRKERDSSSDEEEKKVAKRKVETVR